MSTPRTETTGEPGDKQRATFDAADETLTKSLFRRVRDGSVPLLAGGVLFAAAVRARNRGGSARGRALAAAALVALGLRQRRSSSGLPDAARVALRDTDAKGVSAEANDDAEPTEREEGADAADDGSETDREW